MRAEYKEYSTNNYLNENIINEIRNGSTLMLLFGFITFLIFLFSLYLIIKKNENTSTKYYIVSLIVFFIFDILICLFSSSFNTTLRELNDIINEYESYFSISLYKALIGINKTFYIVNIIYLVVIVIGCLLFSIIHFRAH